VGFAGITTQSAAAELRKRSISSTEFEHGIIRERINAGLAPAKADGTKLGRRVEPAIEAQILELRARGDGILKIGRKLGIGTGVVQRVFKQEQCHLNGMPAVDAASPQA
jgi:hypothetical protein